MSDLNQVTITGRIASPVIARLANNGSYVCDIFIVNNRFDKNGTDHRTFIRTTAWQANAEWAMDNLSKGDFVLINGRLVDDNFKPDDDLVKTKGRLKIDNVKVTLLKKAQ